MMDRLQLKLAVQGPTMIPAKMCVRVQKMNTEIFSSVQKTNKWRNSEALLSF